MARILVTDGHQRSALAVVRSLGRAGHACFVVAPELPASASVSRYCRDSATADMSRAADAARQVRALIRDWQIDFVIPVSDDAMVALGQSLSTTAEQKRLIAPDPAAYALLSDKVALYRRALDLGISVPRSTVAERAGDVPEAGRGIGFPCVVKPHTSVVLDGNHTRHLYVRIAPTPADLADIAASLPAAAFPVLVQERIEGHGEGVFLLADGDQVRASFAHRRLREYPPSGGASTYRESIPVAGDLLRLSSDLLRSVGWKGVAMIEFKRSRSDGRAYLMEVNGRFWGSLQLAIDAGVDFPRLLLQMTMHEAPPPTTTPYRVGVRSRWLWGDIDYLITRLMRDPASLRLADHERGRTRAQVLRDVIRVRRHEHIEEFQWLDPRPFFFESGRQLRRLLRIPRRRSASVSPNPAAHAGAPADHAPGLPHM